MEKLWEVVTEHLPEEQKRLLGPFGPRGSLNRDPKRILAMLEKFAQLEQYESLETLEQVLPLHYVFLLPPRYGVVHYAAYASVLGETQGEIASYFRVRQYLGCVASPQQGGKPTLYVLHLLFRDHFRLFSVLKPIQLLLGQGVKWRPRFGQMRKNRELIEASARSAPPNVKALPEWDHIRTPRQFLHSVSSLLHASGFPAALQFVRFVYRGCSVIRNTFLAESVNWERIVYLATRYFNPRQAIEFAQSHGVARQQSQIDAWLE